MALFKNLAEAGRILAGKLYAYRERRDTLVLALPGGGVPVGYQIAEHLHAPLDVYLVRKVAVPGDEDRALGAVASGGIRVLRQDVAFLSGIDERGVDVLAEQEEQEIDRREHEYRDGRPAAGIDGRTIILTDEGLTQETTMLAAARGIRKQHPAALVVAVPVASGQACDAVRGELDEIVCAETAPDLHSVRECYAEYREVTDDEARALLRRQSAATLAGRASA